MQKPVQDIGFMYPKYDIEYGSFSYSSNFCELTLEKNVSYSSDFHKVFLESST